MLRRIRRKLAEIRYHSASRADSPWGRLMTLALFASFFACWPVSWLTTHLVTEPFSDESLYGRVYDHEKRGGLGVHILEAADAGAFWDAGGVGEITIERRRFRVGWPLPAVIRYQRPEIVFNPFDQPNDRVLDPAAANDAAVAGAVMDALRREQHVELVAAIERGAAERAEFSWWRLAFNALIWWVMMYFTAAVLLQCVRLVVFLARRQMHLRAQDRLYAGRCGRCGYDLTGLEFNERCPECGELV